MRQIKADVHIHTCLSPCSEVSQSPKRVVEKAEKCGLNLIFITDHNTMENAGAAMKTAERFENLRVYPGMEITTKEEVHVLSLFENIGDARNVQEVIHNYLPDVFYEKEKQHQVLANEFNEVDGFYNKSLFSSVDLGLDEIIDLIHQHNGLAIAAHIDGQSFSVISQLGFIPKESRFDALEISPNTSIEKAEETYKESKRNFKFVQGSDSHTLNTLGQVWTEFNAEDNSFESFKQWLQK